MEELTVGRVPDVSEEKKPEPCAHTHNIFFFFFMPPKTRASSRRREPSWPPTAPASSHWCTSACLKASPSPRNPVCQPNKTHYTKNTPSTCWVLVGILKRSTPSNILHHYGMPGSTLETLACTSARNQAMATWQVYVGDLPLRITCFHEAGKVTRLEEGWKEYKTF